MGARGVAVLAASGVARVRGASGRPSTRALGVAVALASLAFATVAAGPASADARVPAPEAVASTAPCVGTTEMLWSTSVTDGRYAGSSSTDASVRVQISCTPAGGNASVPGSGVLLAVTVSAGAVLAGPSSVTTDAAGAATLPLRPTRAGHVVVVVSVADPAMRVAGQVCAPGSPFGSSACVDRVVVDFVAGTPQVPASPYRIPNPRSNEPSPPYLQESGPCTAGSSGAESCASPCYATGPASSTPHSPGCLGLALAAIERGHAIEHLRPLVLPTGFAAMGVGEQLFVLVNLERIARGVPPLVGLVAPLDAAAQQGAVQSRDPSVLTRYGAVRVAVVGDVYGIGGTWAGGEPNSVAAVHDWMYDDGWGGSRAATSNVACTSPSASACWGHRQELLGLYSGTGCRTCVAGVGYDAALRSYTVLIVRPVSPPRLVLGWNSGVLPRIPVAYERVAAPAAAGIGP
ncbi:MAG: hypothetical protein M0Z33_05110 [Actinomycetota bacterium]|nr:hypothetical protein [Actinomycetota bacterium]